MASGTELPDRVDDYELIHRRTLGRGTFGTVYLGKNSHSGEEVAIKVIEPPVQVTRVDYMRYVQTELELLASIQHPHIVRLFQYKMIERCVYVVLELCNSDLQTFAIRNGLSHGLKEQYARDSCAAMGCLHEMRIIHRDLKPENILVKKEGESVIFKFSDLGLSRRIPEGGSLSFTATRGVGTRNWMAPEVSRDPARYSKPADMFGFGLTGLSVMDHTAGEPLVPLTGRNGKCLAELMNDAIRRNETVQIPDISRSTDSPQIRRLKEIYVQTICADPHTRPTIQQVCMEMGHTAGHGTAQPGGAEDAMSSPPSSAEALSPAHSSAEAMPPPPSSAEALAPSLSSAPATTVHSADVGSSVHLSAAMDHSRNRQDVHSPDSEANIPQLAAMDLSPETMSNGSQKCGFCHRGIEVEDVCGRLRVGRGIAAIAAHQKCMQYSALLIQYKFDSFGGFKIEKVKKELKRSIMLSCRICKQAQKSSKKSQVLRVTGATCGCAVKACRFSYHFYCAAKDPTVITRRIETTVNNKKFVKYRVFCGEEHQNLYEQQDETQRTGYESDSDLESETDDDDDDDYEAYNRQYSFENRPVN